MPEGKTGSKSRIADIEYEQMLLSRYTIAQHRHSGGMDRSVYLIMSRIDGSGPMSIAELSHALRLDSSTLQRQVTVAIKDGYLERIPDPEGHVARKIALTRYGNERLADARGASIDALEQIMEDWSAKDIEQFAHLLHRFNNDIEDDSQLRRGLKAE
ncbi:MarR family winged helix-turn-helix transcriptional regulator [Glutamicibacter sp.]|uniref:MarR family winged helix-turn-helix transcriptional regulator n=1 Tax=Glutamicibacter sp. TaxID=1931995 RepID=UPI002FE3DA2C